jgi:hypothetical protein
MKTSFGSSLAWPLTVATILGGGALVAWFFVWFWLAFVVDSIFSVPMPQASLGFTLKGEPLLLTFDYRSAGSRMFHTLDGQEVDPDTVKLLDTGIGNSRLPSARRRAGPLVAQVLAMLETHPVPVFWYLVPDEADRSRAYFVGYDPPTKRPVGYIGLDGFSREVPHIDKQFAVGSLGYASGNFSGYQNAWNQEPLNFGYDGSTKPMAFLVCEGSLFMVDLRKHLVRNLPMEDDVVSIAATADTRAVSDDREAVFDPRVAVRLSDRLLVLNFEGEILRTVALPPAARDQYVELYLTIDHQPILEVTQYTPRQPTEIYWLDDTGAVVRKELAPSLMSNYEPESPWMLAGLFPSPAALAATFLYFRPRGLVDNYLARDFDAALARSVAESWPAFVAVCVLAVISAVVCYRHFHRYGRTGAGPWVIFVLLTGLPGLVGYLLHRRRPAVERCRSCGAVVPRDRQDCLVCAAEFAPPEPRGIEVFA